MGAKRGRDGLHRRHLGPQRVEIVLREGRLRPESAALASGGRRAGQHDEQVRAEALELRLQGGTRLFPEVGEYWFGYQHVRGPLGIKPRAAQSSRPLRHSERSSGADRLSLAGRVHSDRQIGPAARRFLRPDIS